MFSLLFLPSNPLLFLSLSLFSLTPYFKWAQDKEHIYLSLDINGDVSDEKINLTDKTFSFSGKAGDRHYELSFTFQNEIDPSKSKWVKHRLIEILVQKKDTDAEYWDHVLTEYKKFKNHCKTDFSKWVDEEDDKKMAIDHDKFQGFGGSDGANMPGMGGGT